MRRVTTPDGRTLQVHEAGDPNGLPVLVCHGTPGDGSLHLPHADDARARGIRLIGYDRPGYGGSSPHRGRSVADGTRDVDAIADALGLERLAVWGLSGGGPHALACAALLAGRVVAVASLAAVGPYGVEGLDWLDGMGQDNIEEFGATLEGRDALQRYLEEKRTERLHGDAVQLRDELSTLLTPVDAEALTGDFAEYVDESMRRGLEPAVDGWLDDDLAFVQPWGFDLAAIETPVLLWHGEHDQFVPFAHGRWLAERIPTVDARLSPDDGHLTLATRRMPEVHAWLIERLQA